MNSFQLLYPAWLLLIPVWALLVYGMYRYRHYTSSYDDLVDEELRDIVLTGQERKKPLRFWLPALVGFWLLLVLAGPSFHSNKVPVFEVQHGLVIGLDLSSSMLVEDVQPNRLQRARFELLDLLKLRKEGQTGLVVFAGDAFVVAPMTTDVDTIISQVGHLEPSMMPAQGSRMDRAIEESTALLQNSGYNKGHILMLSDGLANTTATRDAAKSALKKGYDVSILAIGTELGGTIPLEGNELLKNNQGEPVIAKLDLSALQQVTQAGNGTLLSFDITDKDTLFLQQLYQTDKGFELNADKELEYPVNSGIWMLFPLVFVVMLMFRKGYVWVAVFYLMSGSDPVYAFDWNNLWLNQDQLGKKLLDQGKPESAQKSFRNTQWKAAAAYRAKDYMTALELFQDIDTVAGWYNRGNVLAQMGQPAKAISAYQEVLEREPDHEDAKYNLSLLIEIEEQKFASSYRAKGNADSDKPGTDGDSNAAEFDSGKEETAEMSVKDQEAKAYNDQWLKSIPDDPSGLWRRKFLYQYKNRGQQSEVEPW